LTLAIKWEPVLSSVRKPLFVVIIEIGNFVNLLTFFHSKKGVGYPTIGHCNLRFSPMFPILRTTLSFAWGGPEENRKYRVSAKSVMKMFQAQFWGS
jgi:hypothetical protein